MKTISFLSSEITLKIEARGEIVDKGNVVNLKRTVHDHENIDMVNEIWARLENQLKPKGWVLYSLWFTVKNYETRLDVEIWKVVVLPI